jgi:hypothetical protein
MTPVPHFSTATRRDFPPAYTLGGRNVVVGLQIGDVFKLETFRDDLSRRHQDESSAHLGLSVQGPFPAA